MGIYSWSSVSLIGSLKILPAFSINRRELRAFLSGTGSRQKLIQAIATKVWLQEHGVPNGGSVKLCRDERNTARNRFANRVRKHRSRDSSVFTWQAGSSSRDKLPGGERSRSLPRNTVCSFLLSQFVREANGLRATSWEGWLWDWFTLHRESKKGEGCTFFLWI